MESSGCSGSGQESSTMELIQLAVPVLLKGLRMTAILTAVSVLIGFNLGLGLALMRLSSNRFLAGFAKYYSNVFRGTPLLVQIFLFYYGLGQLSLIKDNAALWWVISDGARCAVLALALNTAAYTSEILRGGLMSIPVGLVEAAQACGMSRMLRFRRIEFSWRSAKRCQPMEMSSFWSSRAQALRRRLPCSRSPVMRSGS